MAKRRSGWQEFTDLQQELDTFHDDGRTQENGGFQYKGVIQYNKQERVPRKALHRYSAESFPLSAKRQDKADELVLDWGDEYHKFPVNIYRPVGTRQSRRSQRDSHQYDNPAAVIHDEGSSHSSTSEPSSPPSVDDRSESSSSPLPPPSPNPNLPPVDLPADKPFLTNGSCEGDDEESIIPPVPEKKVDYPDKEQQTYCGLSACICVILWIGILVILALLVFLLLLFVIQVSQVSLDGEMALNNVTYTEELGVSESTEFKKLQGQFCDALMLSVDGAGSCSVQEFRDGSVIVLYELTFQTTLLVQLDTSRQESLAEEVDASINESIAEGGALQEEFGPVENRRPPRPVPPSPPATPPPTPDAPPFRTTTTSRPYTTDEGEDATTTVEEPDVSTEGPDTPDTSSSPTTSAGGEDEKTTVKPPDGSTESQELPSDTTSARVDTVISTSPSLWSETSGPPPPTTDNGVTDQVSSESKTASSNDIPVVTSSFDITMDLTVQTNPEESGTSPDSDIISSFKEDATSTVKYTTPTVGCEDEPCQNNATCTETGNGFICNCTETFTGKLCESEIDPCNPNPCNNGACLRGDGLNFECVCAQCDCVNEYLQPLCEKDFFACDGFPDGAFLSHPDDCGYYFRCGVPPGDKVACLNNQLATMDPVEACVDKDESNCTLGDIRKFCDDPEVDNCGDNGDCTNTEDGFLCNCYEGFTGRLCETEIITCEAFGEKCLSNGTCQDTPEGFICVCPIEYTGRRCEQDFHPCDPNPCMNGGTCIRDGWNYTCICAVCSCANDMVQPNCENDLRNCDWRKSGYYPDPVDCGYYVDCSTEGQVHRMQCGGGQVSSPDPEVQCEDSSVSKCRNIDIPIIIDCNMTECDNNGTCIDTPDGFFCVCEPEYTGTNCEILIQSCSNDTCVNGGTCQDTPDGFICLCPIEFTGRRCDQDFHPCDPNPCMNGGTCIRDGWDYTCICAACSCANDMVQPNCENDLRNCDWRKSGYYPDPVDCGYYVDCSTEGQVHRMPCSEGQVSSPNPNVTCEDAAESQCRNIDIPIIIDCTMTECENNGTCIDTPDGFYCVCEPEYTGTNCEILIQSCSNETCLNGGTCEDIDEMFLCHCPVPFTGIFCETEVTPCDPDPCKNNATCLSDGYDFTCDCGYECICANKVSNTCAIDLTTCDGTGMDTVLLPHPDDCNYYIQCHHGRISPGFEKHPCDLDPPLEFVCSPECRK